MKRIFSIFSAAAALLAVHLALSPGLAVADEGGGPPQWGPMGGGMMGYGHGHEPGHGAGPWGMQCEGDAEKCRAEMQARMEEHFKEWFKKADRDGNGSLSKAEAGQGMPMLARDFDEIDANKDGQITLEEFEAYNRKKMDEFAKQREECKSDPDKCHAEMLDRMKDKFKKADANNDGMLTMAEAEKDAPMVAHQFYELDADKDGQVSLKEFTDFHNKRYDEARKKRAAALARLEKQFKKADANHDGVLSMAEAEKGAPDLAKCFADLDVNNDGVLSLDEARASVPMHPGMDHHHGHDGMMMKGPHGHGGGGRMDGPMPPHAPMDDGAMSQ